MTPSDDEYGFDDLVLDDRTLAVLDATERNFTTHARPRSSPERQPTKRLKTNQGWVPRHVQQQQPEREMSSVPRGLTRSRFSLEDTDLPEITISNGFYSGPGRFFVATPQSQRQPSASPNAPSATVDSDVVLLPTPTVRNVQAPGRNIAAPPNRQPRVSAPSITSVPGTERSIRSVVALGSGHPPPRDPSPARASPLTRSSSFSDAMRTALRNAISETDGLVSSTASSDSPSPMSAVPQVRLPSQVVTLPRRERSAHLLRRERSLPPTQRLQVSRQPSPHPTGSQHHQSTPRDPAVRDELEALRSEVEDLRRRNAEQQRTLDQAVNEKRSKIGEVEILRANLQKAATVHNEETAKLRAAKESLEAAQVAAQKKQEAELERLRTQLVFKQHEMESSRKAAVSRAPVPPAPSQAPAPSQQVPRWDVPRTPRRQHRPPAAAQQSPSPHRPKRPVSKAQQHVLLPGFVNDFAVPLAAKKGKGIARTHHASQNQGMRERDLVPQLPPPRTQIDEYMDYGDGQPTEIDFHMDFGDDFRAPRPQHVAGGTARPFDWLGWMRQLVLAHSMSPTAQSTIQLLLTQPPFDANHATTFSLACTSLMDAVAASAGSYDPIARVVVDSLAQIVNILLIGVRLKPLASTLNLLGVLAISLPSFSINLLKPTNGPAFLETICTMIVNLMQPSNTNGKECEKVEERELYLTVAREVFSLLDAIIYSLPPEYHYQLAIIPQTANVLKTMLSNHQPTSFLECSARTLSYLSTRSGLFRSLISFADDVPEIARDFSKLPQVVRMCALLIDPSRTAGIKGHSIRASILATLISLAMAHDDALTILSESPFFIPSLVALLADLSTALWEEDPGLMASPELLSQTVAGIAQGVLLMHYVIFRSPQGPASLRARLQAAPQRHFNGIGHQFVVALGRLSFAEPPDDVAPLDRAWLEQLADPARDIMDLVVAGPESESVWSLFQEDEDGRDEALVAGGGAGGGSTVPEGDDDIVMQADIGMLFDDDSQLEYI